MSQVLTIIADIYAEPDQIEKVKIELENLIKPTLAEEGCLQYDLHQDNEDPAHFLFFENWKTRELWQKHMKAPHIEAFGPATEGAIAKVSLFEMTKAD
ncbi:MAG: putative quinol monooxygenase [Verrucomicrobiota bacterium]